MAKKKDADIVEKKETAIVEKKPKKVSKKKDDASELTEQQQGLIDNFISLLTEMKTDKESAEAKLDDLLIEEGIANDEFEDSRKHFLSSIIIRYLEIYGVLTKKEIFELLLAHFPYSNFSKDDIEEVLEEYFELYHPGDKLYIHPLFMDEDMYSTFVPIIHHLRKGKKLYPVCVAELIVFQEVVMWLPKYTIKAEEMIKKYKLKIGDMKDLPDLLKFIWVDIQCSSLTGKEIGRVFEKDFSKKKNAGLKEMFDDIVQHTRLWALNGKMLCE